VSFITGFQSEFLKRKVFLGLYPSDRTLIHTDSRPILCVILDATLFVSCSNPPCGPCVVTMTSKHWSVTRQHDQQCMDWPNRLTVRLECFHNFCRQTFLNFWTCWWHEKSEDCTVTTECDTTSPLIVTQYFQLTTELLHPYNMVNTHTHTHNLEHWVIAMSLTMNASIIQSSINQSINQSAYFRVAYVTLLPQSYYINVTV